MLWETKAVGALLLLGGMTFLLGAAFWKPAEFQQPLPAALRSMFARRRRLRWVQVWMIVGVVFTSTGVAGLWSLQGQSGDRLIASVGVALFFLGAVPMLVSLTFGLTLLPWAAEETARTGSIPQGFEPLKRWADLLYAIHMALSYMSIATLGLSLLRTALVSGWVGWAGLVVGLSFAIGFAAFRGGPFGPPILVHVWPTLLGVLLLLSA